MPSEPASTIEVGEHFILFEGPLGDLSPHQHGGLVVVVALHQPFVFAAGDAEQRIWAALIPPLLEHRLEFCGARVIAYYLDPTHRLFGPCFRLAAEGPRTLTALDATWQQGIGATGTCDSRALDAAIERAWGVAGPAVDPRVRALCGELNAGERLDDDTDTIARACGLSSSRLTHLLALELGSGLRRIKQYYRFKLVAREVARGANLTHSAHAAGFSDSAHFSRAFRETYGLSPTELLLGGVRWIGAD